MSGYIGVQPVPQATQRREYFTATNGQATFNTNGYTPNYIDVYMNGVKLSPADFTASNGSDVVLASGATTGDLVQVVSFTPFNVANQTFIGDVNLSSGAYKIGGNTVIDSSRNATFTTVGTPAGSAAAPAYTFSTDTNTGMFKRGTDQIGFTAGGTEYVAMGSFGLAVDTIQNKASAGDLTLNVAGSIILDADSGDINFKDNGVETLRYSNSASGPQFFSPVTNKDIIFKGKDDTATITALTLDMSEAGAATFNSSITATGAAISGAVIGTYNTAPSGSPGQLAISRTGSAPYVSWHHEDGTRLGNIQFANASNTLYLSNEMSNGKWNFWNGTTTAAEIDHNGAAYFGGTTQAAATRFVHLGGIKFSNGASTGGEFLSWDNEGNTGNQSLLAYWYNGSSYRNRFRIAGDHGETVVNGSGDDVDFRVASDGNQDMLFLDASANKIGIGSQSYNYGSALTVHANDSGGAPTSLFLRNSGTAGGSGATIQAGYTSGYGAQIRFSGNPSSYRMASTTFATVTGDGTTQDNVQISTSGDTIIYNDLGVGHAGNPNHVLDVESSVSGDWVSQIHNTHNSNGFGLKVRAGDNGDVNSFRVAAQNNDILLNVDGAGRATMPKQPRFHATKTSGHGTTGKITFNTADVNVGNNYNTSTGTFTAPVAGDYLITTTALSNNGTTIGLDLLKNGNRYAVTEESFTGAAYRSTSITAIVPLSANDTLQVHNKQGAYYGTSRYTFFAGHLIG